MSFEDVRRINHIRGIGKESQSNDTAVRSIFGIEVEYADFEIDEEKIDFISNGSICATVYYKDNLIHRDGGVAVHLDLDGYTHDFYVKSGVFHREDGPACIKVGLSKKYHTIIKYMQNGRYHPNADGVIESKLTSSIRTIKYKGDNYSAVETYDGDDLVYYSYVCEGWTAYCNNEKNDIVYRNPSGHDVKYDEFVKNVTPVGMLM